MNENISTIKERILYYAKKQGIGVGNLLDSIDMTSGSFKGIARKTSINSDALVKIYTLYPNINMKWLLTGQGKMIVDTLENDNIMNEPTPQYGNDRLLPLVSMNAAAGFGNSHFAISDQDIQAMYCVPDFNHVDFMIRVKGNSMYPKYSSGDIIACRILRDSKFIEWNKPHLVSTAEHGILVKRLRRCKDESCITAVSDNKEYDPFDIPKSEITGIAIIVGVIRLE